MASLQLIFPTYCGQRALDNLLLLKWYFSSGIQKGNQPLFMHFLVFYFSLVSSWGKKEVSTKLLVFQHKMSGVLVIWQRKKVQWFGSDLTCHVWVSCVSTACSGAHTGPVWCVTGSRWQCSDPSLQKLALETWNITSLVGKEPVLVCEVKKYQLDGFTSVLWVLKPISLRRIGSCSTLKCPMMWGVRLVWLYKAPWFH